MLPWLKRFFTDETAFIGLIRAACLGLGTAVATGQIDLTALHVPQSAGIALAALGGFIRAGEKNPK